MENIDNELPKKYKNSFFIYIKKFFAGIFRKKQEQVTDKMNDIEQKVDMKTKQVESTEDKNELEKMKVLSNEIKLKEDIISLIEKNPALLDTLSIERLEELEKMYDMIIEKNEMKIKKLKREIS